MNDRFLTILNVCLIAISGLCVWYLFTGEYSQPTEIRSALNRLGGAETDFTGSSDTDFNPPAVQTPMRTPEFYAGLQKPFTEPLFTPTPTPTPTPSPTPVPPNLAVAVQSWSLIGIVDDKTVEMQETRDGSTFTMSIGGAPVIAKDADGRDVQVRLLTVDLENYRVSLGFMEQVELKAM